MWPYTYTNCCGRENNVRWEEPVWLIELDCHVTRDGFLNNSQILCTLAELLFYSVTVLLVDTFSRCYTLHTIIKKNTLKDVLKSYSTISLFYGKKVLLELCS